MRWADADAKIGSRCVLSIRQDSPLFEYSRKYRIYAPVLLRHENDEIVLTMLLDKVEERSTKTFSKIFYAEDHGGKLFIKYPIKPDSELSIINSILNTPSIVMSYVHLELDTLYIDFRFHSSRTREISDSVFGYLKTSNMIEIEQLSTGSGAFSFLEEISARTPLSMIEFSFPVQNDDLIYNSLSENNGVGEVQKKPGRDYSMLLYLESPAKNMKGLSLVSVNDNIYETSGNSPYLQKLRSLCNDALIFRAEHFMRTFDGRILVSVFVHTSQTEDFLRVLARINTEKDTQSIVLHRVVPFNPELSKTL